ncbi:MAG TPA: hypothetical protein VN539_01030, partial [Candidatus Saccharimonadales bacterium]|nr:hypothetical protein [Candidatus Saccharimonadales bacterium]
VAVSSSLVAIGSHDHLGIVRHGAYAPGSGTLAAATDHELSFLHEESPGVLSLLETRAYADGRQILRVQARADSFLVLSVRTSPTLRMLLTLYRVRSASAPESLWEFQANGFQPQDMVWPDAIAFVAVGNSGVLPFDTETRLAAPAVPVSSGTFVRSLDADAGSVVVAGQARVYAQFTRSGPKGRTLVSEVDHLAALDPFHIALVGGLAVISEDEFATPIEPDEVGTSLLEVRDVSQPAQPGRTTTTGLGRARRVVYDAGLAYVADYTGGLRIYRAAPADTSLVGVLPLAGNARVFDLALDPVRHVVYLAAGTGGMAVVDVTDPASPSLASSVTLPGQTIAVASIDSALAVAGRRGGNTAGVTFINVSNLASPVPRGALNFPTVLDPRGFAFRDTALFVADAVQGLLTVSFHDPDAPVPIGVPSGMAARDVDLSGTLLLVGTMADGLQVVDVTDPSSLVLRGTVLSPSIFGVAQQGQTGLALLGNGGALAVDLRNPSLPLVRGMIAVPGFSRDAAWIGDTLLIAESFGLERFGANPTVSVDPALTLSTDPDALLPRVQIVWFASLPPGALGWNVFRDVGSAAQGQPEAVGVRVNESLLDPLVRAAIDEGVLGGTTYRYRLEAFFPDGSSLKVAEGSIFIGSNSALGRVYPNPYRPRGGQTLQIPYRVLSVDGGKSIDLRVFDLLGRLVRHIPGVTAPGGGFGSFSWDGRDDRGRLLADGVYFVHLNGPGIDDARQLILLR